MSTLEVDKIIPQSGTNLQVGEASDTIKVPSGATLDIESGATLDATGATITGFDAASDEKVKVTANDTTPGFLTTKVLAGTNISLTVGNASNNETLTAAFTGNLNASITNAGTFADARIPNLNASKITAGTLDAGRIPNLNASKINAGTIATARLGSGTASSSTFLRGDQTYATPAGGVTFKEGGTNFTNSLLVGQNSTGTLSSAEGNVGVGPGVFESLTSGDNNIAVGRDALTSVTTGQYNTAVGKDALDAVISGGFNTAVGLAALGQATSSNNVAVGDRALDAVTSGANNIALGSESGAASNWLKWTTESNRLTLGNNDITNSYVKVDWTVGSDVRDKTNFGTIPHGLNFVNQLNPVSFQFKKSREDDTPHGNLRYGFKAQEILALEKANNGTNVIVDDEFEEHLNLTNSHLTPILVKAIKEQQTVIENLTTRITTLENA